jgi:RNA polymerase sigma factor (sigma-70 family)
MADRILIIKFKEGNVEARRSVYERVYPPLLSLASRLTKDKMQAEEIVQDSFMKILNKKDYEYKNIKELMKILYSITYRACMDHLRKVDRENKGMSKYRMDVTHQEPTDDTLNVEKEFSILVAVIKTALLKQPKKRRQVIEYLIDGKDPKEIAELMNINQSGVYKHRDAFKEYLIEKEGIDLEDLAVLFGS